MSGFDDQELEAAEDEFDRKIAETADKLVPLAEKALAEFLAGQTEPLEKRR